MYLQANKSLDEPNATQRVNQSVRGAVQYPQDAFGPNIALLDAGNGEPMELCREASAAAKATWLRQFQCKQCDNWWWGVSRQCRICRRTVAPVQLKDMLGIGWFECDQCDRKFAGFCQGNVPSACHSCGKKCWASFIVPGAKASSSGRDHHDCNECHGDGKCWVVEMAKQRASKGQSHEY
ncbi:hypothetical protein H310_05494 [Aphanomyces invadans]|uniref:Uncharacterized protein n=1 Tax=Aphanomyces invadans TaxID=157072 RepID=A0A024U9G6_9STRA|nr:hypothetical protein H310_05494 [Aphanomyces invadans]ETW03066.1 hypothetical protein H310_05494 [Aphanomyces invadans]|eukprot:XP_008868450.1 hypothetical protein H310_05494 [Aphanomyces invadans]